jgi:hypothetical protein
MAMAFGITFDIPGMAREQRSPRRRSWRLISKPDTLMPRHCS